MLGDLLPAGHVLWALLESWVWLEEGHILAQRKASSPAWMDVRRCTWKLEALGTHEAKLVEAFLATVTPLSSTVVFRFPRL